MKHFNSLSEFDKEIKGNKLVVVDFYATWCGPCKVIAPRFEKLADQYPNVIFAKVDVDQAKDVASKAGVRAMPTFHFYKQGQKLDEVVGADINKVERLTQQYSKDSSAFPSGGGRVLGTGQAESKSSSPSPEGDRTQQYILYALVVGLFIYLYFGKSSESVDSLPDF